MTIHASFPDFILRDPVRADGAAFVRYLNDLSIAGWLARPPFPYRPEDAEAFLEGGFVGWPCRAAIDVGGELVGMVSVDPHLGYWLAPAFRGQGIVGRAATALIEAHFARADVESIRSGAFEGNAASLAVLARLGFRETGRTREYCRPLGVYRPHLGYSLARSNWSARATGEARPAPLFESRSRTLSAGRAAEAVAES